MRLLKRLYHQPATIMAVIYGCLMFCIIAGIIALDVPTDIQAHTDVLTLHLEQGGFPVPPLYFATIHLVSFVFGKHLLLASAVVLALASTARFLVASHFYSPLPQAWGNWPAAFVLLLLMFLAPLPWHTDGYWLMGTFSAMILHNSTILFVFPFCIWLFYLGLRFFETSSWRLVQTMMLAMALVALAKPNYLLAFLPCFWFFSVLKKPRQRGFILKASLVAAGGTAMVMAVKYWMTQANTGIYELTSIRIAPFATWLHFSRFPLVDFLLSFPFVLTAAFLFPGLIFKHKETQFALAITAVSLAVYWLFAETGERQYASNFIWQVPVAIFLLHLSLFKCFGSHWTQVRSSPNFKWVLAAAGLQVLGGLSYIIRMFVTKDYM